MRLRGNWRAQLPIVFGVIIASFVSAMIFAQWQLVAVGKSSLEIADKAAPSIEHLATARGEVRRLQVLLRNLPHDLRELEDVRHAMDEALAQYLVIPVEPKEQGAWLSIIRARDALDRDLGQCVAKAEQGDFGAMRALVPDVVAAADVLSVAITRDIEMNASRSHALALEIATLHDRSREVAFLLAGLCALVTVGGAMTLRGAMRTHSELAERHRVLLEERASELEQFAGRIAHDILSPVSVVGLALKLSSGPNVNEAMRAELAGRGSAAISRINRLVSGLLSFAVAGAKPSQDASADVDATVVDLLPELRAEAKEAGATIDVDINVESLVACNAGVLTSIVSNLARNAIKYIGDGPVRRIDVRAHELERLVRLEVQDTGPGLLPDLAKRVFEPYVRGQNTSKGGIGLGLATVRRVVTAHGGTVGVRSIPGAGCTFWVELPKATTRAAPAASGPAMKSA